MDPVERFLVKLVVLGPRNAGLANSRQHKPSYGGRRKGRVAAERISAEAVAEQSVNCSDAAVRLSGRQ